MINCENDGWRVQFIPRDRCSHILKENVNMRKVSVETARSALSDEQKQQGLDVCAELSEGGWVIQCFRKKRVTRSEPWSKRTETQEKGRLWQTHHIPNTPPQKNPLLNHRSGSQYTVGEHTLGIQNCVEHSKSYKYEKTSCLPSSSS